MRRFPLFLLSLLPLFAGAQSFQSVFPTLSGAELIDSVAAHYRPNVVLDYAHARDTLFAKVLAVDDDTLRCIYSGYALYLDPTQDPTQYVFLNGSTLGINTEHSYPQSKGATVGTNAHSDMHHLYPTRIPLNDARADKPYADIPDAQTDQWFRGAQVLTSPPPLAQRDQYAESNENAFEPREAVKGDLARSVFYFYTMYRSQANAADPTFFETQRATLCQWAAQDPADSAELRKTWRIAAYQEGKANPFVLDCTLARRTWCPEVGGCLLPTHQAGEVAPLGLRLSPNPWLGAGKLEMLLPFTGNLEVRLLAATGQKIAAWQVAEAPGGRFDLALEAPVGMHGQLAWLEVRLLGEADFLRAMLPVVLW